LANAGARSLAPAGTPADAVDVADVGAPGPSSSGLPAADILFTISAGRARLTADKLTLSGVADTAVWTTRHSVAGIDSTGTTCLVSTVHRCVDLMFSRVILLNLHVPGASALAVGWWHTRAACSLTPPRACLSGQHTGR